MRQITESKAFDRKSTTVGFDISSTANQNENSGYRVYIKLNSDFNFDKLV